MTLKSFDPKERHEKFRLALVEAMRGFEDLSAQEILAIAAQFVGQLVAVQDQRFMTQAMAIDLVTKNIVTGNKTAIMVVEKPAGNA